MENKINNVAVEERLFRWVKASERLPELVMSVNLKIDGRPAFGKFFEQGEETVLGFEASNGFGTLYNHQFDMISWLEEIPIKEHLPVVEDGKIKKAIDWCNEKIKDRFHPNEPVANEKYAGPYKEMKQFLESL